MARQTEFETETFRVSFPYLAQPSEYNGKLTYKLDAIFDPNTAKVFWDNLVIQANALLATEYPGQENLFTWFQMKDGNLNIAKSDPQQAIKNGYAGNWYMTFNSPESVGCVKFDVAQGCDISIDPKQIYSGCYARAYIQVWLQDNSFGKRVNIKLLAVKFVNDGDSLGGSVPVNPTGCFAPGQGQLPPGAQVTPGAPPMQTVHQAPAGPGAQPPQQPYQQQPPAGPGAQPPQQPVSSGGPVSPFLQ